MKLEPKTNAMNRTIIFLKNVFSKEFFQIILSLLCRRNPDGRHGGQRDGVAQCPWAKTPCFLAIAPIFASAPLPDIISGAGMRRGLNLLPSSPNVNLLRLERRYSVRHWDEGKWNLPMCWTRPAITDSREERRKGDVRSFIRVNPLQCKPSRKRV